MNKLAMPSVLVATVMIAGIFALMPVDQASTVHTTIQATGDRQLLLTATVTPATAAADVATWIINQPFEVVAATATNTVDAGGNNNLAATTIVTNLVESNDITEINPKVFTAVGDDVPIIDGTNFDGTTANEWLIFGSTTLAITTAAEGGTFAATDSVTLWVLINTRGDVALPTATLS